MGKLRIAKWQAKEGNDLEAKGLIRLNQNKPEFGSLMLIEPVVTINNGFASTRNKTGFITGNVKDLVSMINQYGLKENDDFSEKVGPHKIVTVEKVESELTASDLGYREKINPSTGEILTKNGEQIFWRTFVVSEASDMTDKYVAHDRVAVDTGVEEFQNAETEEGN